MSKYRNNRRNKRPSAYAILDAELVPLTDELIMQLALKWDAPAEEIRAQRDNHGVKYCPARDSLMTDWVAFN